MDVIETLKELTGVPAVSGGEKNFAWILSEKFKSFCDEVEIDRFHNVVGVKRGQAGQALKVMITAHMDEIGLIVTGIDERGFVSFSNVGGIDARILPAQEVVIHGKVPVEGVIGAKPPHLLAEEERRKAVKWKDLRIDTGLDARLLKEQISIGDLITFKAVPFELKNRKLTSKAMDNRASVTAMLYIMEELNHIKHGADVYFAATCQEEFRLAGAIITSYTVQPDIAIVIDAGHGDTPDASREDVFPLGKGPAVGIGPILNRKLSKRAQELAKEEGIPYQIDAEPSSTGTEAWATQVSRAGIRTVLLSIPVRYMHTPVETVHTDDIRNTARLAVRLIRDLSVNDKT